MAGASTLKFNKYGTYIKKKIKKSEEETIAFHGGKPYILPTSTIKGIALIVNGVEKIMWARPILKT